MTEDPDRFASLYMAQKCDCGQFRVTPTDNCHPIVFAVTFASPFFLYIQTGLFVDRTGMDKGGLYVPRRGGCLSVLCIRPSQSFEQPPRKAHQQAGSSCRPNAHTRHVVRLASHYCAVVPARRLHQTSTGPPPPTAANNADTMSSWTSLPCLAIAVPVRLSITGELSNWS
jgi:hypothetical protein